MDIAEIQRRVQAGAYLVKRDAILHAVKEGFLQQDMVNVVLSGQVIESYPDRQRVLVCGPTTLATETVVYLHVVCQYSDPVYIEFVTAYIPDETIWERPPSGEERENERAETCPPLLRVRRGDGMGHNDFQV